MEIAQTPRLRLHEFDNGDVPALAAILADPEVMRYSLGGVHDEAQTRRFIAGCRASYAEHGLGAGRHGQRGAGGFLWPEP
ncbi:hypothetical protein HPA02_12320 [Bisbaumannia pacifica]|uniref:N-acetyltransferase domain-containing protein n=1 Tax=Bisbaumannia pacifica TaxID=77098 RepID=A0A510X6B3_9GAMM|nr:GNAT family N-acetyltransferase [Halomonas pacifica]GEK46949.1 hypothetical protein HPA02_12320 [Halomonas pacifica]